MCPFQFQTSTCVLLKPDKKFEAFGFEAETQYSSLSIEGKHEAWFLFRNFKMKLYEIRVINVLCLSYNIV